jgi:hypothetical protein
VTSRSGTATVSFVDTMCNKRLRLCMRIVHSV